MTEQQTDPGQTGPLPDLPETAYPAGATPLPAQRKRYTIPDPDDITFGEAWEIKAATGIDVINPDNTGEQLVALLWWAARDDKMPLSMAKTYTARDVDFDIPEPDPAEDRDVFDPETADTEADPTHGSGPGQR